MAAPAAPARAPAASVRARTASVMETMAASAGSRVANGRLLVELLPDTSHACARAQGHVDARVFGVAQVRRRVLLFDFYIV
mmetsp:Transcript_59806/g.119734  ORF Transcript_59806/g.119734 Transcript_59806/m.119734 type:complete len:81 (+) Transcript_59806:159-401(+)